MGLRFGAMEGVEELRSSLHIDEGFWKNKKVVVTGHTGFKGSWLCILLDRLGAQVSGYSLAPNLQPNLYDAANIKGLLASSFIGDILEASIFKSYLVDQEPEIIFHLAAQPLVRKSYEFPLQTIATNVTGTANVLQAMRDVQSISAAVMVTTDKVYENKEWVWPYREDDRLGGRDPYSASKAASELIISSYRDSFFADAGARIGSARAGNVIGGGDWSADRLFPDLVRAWQEGDTLEVRNPHAVRPWQHVLEPLSGYLVLAQKLSMSDVSAGAFNFGPKSGDAKPVGAVVNLAQRYWGRGCEADVGPASGAPHEATLLDLDISKSTAVLGFEPAWSLETAIEKTITWYKNFKISHSALELCQQDIEHYFGG